MKIPRSVILIGSFYSAFATFVLGVLLTSRPLHVQCPAAEVQAPMVVSVFPDVVAELKIAPKLWISAIDERNANYDALCKALEVVRDRQIDVLLGQACWLPLHATKVAEATIEELDDLVKAEVDEFARKYASK